MAMSSRLKLELWNRSDGSARMMITTVQVDPRKVMNARDYARIYGAHLARLKQYDRAMIIIDSRGGAFDSALGLLDAIRAECNHNHVKAAILIDGTCASAATFVAAGLKKVPVYITPGGKYYVHMPKMKTYHRRGGGVWEVIVKAGRRQTVRAMVDMYHTRTRQKKKVIRQWMEEGKYFNAQEAVEAGFCDGIMTRAEFEKGGAWNGR